MKNWNLALKIGLVISSCILFDTKSDCQILMASSNSYTQDFNTLTTSGSSTWSDNSTIANWYSQRTGSGTTIVADAGTNNAGNLYSYGTGTNSDRAIGTVGSGGTGAGHFAHGVLLKNTSGTSITSISISYTLEQWRSAGAQGAQSITFWYKTSPTIFTNLNPNSNSTWTQVTSLLSTSPVFTGSAGALDGNNPANQYLVSTTSIPSLNLANSNFIMLKWEDPDHSGTDHGLSIDDVTVSWDVTPTCTPPSTQATSFSATNIQTNQMDANWTRGNGDNVLVVARQGSAVNADPSNGTSYTANPVFGSGSQIGTGNYVVYNGPGTSETVTGLTAFTTYHYAVYEYNSVDNCYNLTELTGNGTTLCSPPTIQAFNFSATNIQANQMQVNWSRGNGTGGVLVVARQGSPVDADPVNGTNYTANAAFMSGTQIGTGNYVVYKGTGTNITVTTLTASTDYYYAIYEYNTNGTCFNLTELTGNATTLCSPPTTQANGFNATDIQANQMQINWNRGNGTAGVLVLARQGSPVNADPVSGNSYSANAVFGAGDQIGTGNYVVYNGAGTSEIITGLSVSTTYYYAIYEYNTNGTCYNTTELTGNGTTICNPPATQASGFMASNIQTTQMQIDWVRGDGDNVLVVARQGGAVNADPTSGTPYIANSIFTSGSQIGTGNYVVYNGTGTSVTVTGLTAGTIYHFAIYEYSNTGTCYNTTELTGNATTTFPEIQLEYPIGTNVNCGFSLNFGNVTIGSSSSLTVRISNTGTADLNLTALPLSNSGDYSVTTQPTSPIPAGSFSDVTIQFTPTTTGTRTGSISIANNDNTGSENPCGISLTGVGLLVNDNCSGATALTVSPTPTCGGATSGTTVGATSSGLPAIQCSTFNGNADDDVWYSFVATNTNHTITVVGLSSFDAVVDLRSGACNGTHITCVDAAVNGGTEVINAANLTIGETYLIRIYSYGDGSGYKGAFTVCVTTPSPDIQLKESGTTNRACGYTFNMGTVNVGSTASLTVRIQNTATIAGVNLNLTSLPLSITGADASEFSITTQPTSPIAYNNAFSDVIIQFAPTSNGPKTATIIIDNNDFDENPCSFNLSGTGFQALYYQSKQSGNWTDPNTWEVSTVSSNGPWSNASATPNSNDLEINIKSTNTITISSGTVTVDQLTLYGNSMLEVLSSGSLIIADGVGTDLTVNGILKNASTITTNGTLVIANGGIYQHNWTTSYGTIPTATWSSGSTCEILGYTSPPSGNVPSGITQSFSNFSWNTANMTTSPNLGGATINVSGTFYMVTTGTGELRLGSSTSGTINTLHFSQSGGTINCSNDTGSGRIKVAGNFEQSGGTITEAGATGNGTIEITGPANITVTGGSIMNSIIFLINCPSSVARLLSDLTLDAPTTLSLSAGKLNLNGYELKVATISGTPTWGSTTTSYIIAESGNLRRTIGSSTLFPVGTASEYMPCQLTGSGEFKVNISSTLSGLTNSSQALSKQWNITFGSGTLGMGFQWPSNVFGNTTYLYKHDGSGWANVGGPVTATGTGPLTASFANISCCSGFTVGGLAALPVELAYFRATPVAGKVQLDWRTYSEINNSHFLIEKSNDGMHFQEIGKKDGQGTTLETTDYQFTDEAPNTGINYYRLKQMDFDGKYEYSHIVSVTFNGRKGQVQLFPSLATNEVYLHFPTPTEEQASLKIFDLSGKTWMEMNVEEGLNDLTIPILELRAGHYFVQINNGQVFETLRFVKQ